MPRPILSPDHAQAVALAAALSLTAPLACADDALVIGQDDIVVGTTLNFGKRLGPHLTLYNPDYNVGIQSFTMYFRSNRNFAWYHDGSHADSTLAPGDGGSVLMTLSSAPAAGAGTLDVNGTITGKGAVPVGAILMWSGNPEDLPAGWVLCDGNNGTPNLSGRFIVGYQAGQPDYAVGKTGGEAAHTLTTDETPAHDHGAAGDHSHTLWASGHGWAFPVVQTGDRRVRNDSHTVRTSANGQHTHASVGGGQPHENRPPFLALAYIMYTGQ